MTAICNNQPRKHHNMKKFIAMVCTGLLLALIGCGGGGGGGATAGPGATPVIPEPQQPEQPVIPPPLSVFDCNSDGPVQRSEVDSLPGGIFYGTLFDCTTNTAEYVYAVVNDQGDFSIVSSAGGENAKQLTGSLHADGDVFHGSGNLYTGQDVSSRLWVDGYIAQRTSLDGRWGTESGSYGFFQASSYTEAWSFEPPLNTPVAGFKDNYRTTLTLTWVFEADGHVSAEDTSGCKYAGQMTPSLPQFNIFELELTLSDCALAGTYSGLSAAWAGGGVPFEMAVSVEDGAGRALNILVGVWGSF